MKTVRLGLKLTERGFRTARALANPPAWQAYKRNVLEKVTLQAKAAIQSEAARAWKRPTGSLDNSWFSRVDPSTGRGVIWNSKAYAYHLNYGVRPHAMTYLLNSTPRTYMAWGTYPYQAKPPIPLRVSGGLLFRRVTAEAIRAGKWHHPGFPPYSFVENGIEWYRINQMPRDISGLLVEVVNT